VARGTNPFGPDGYRLDGIALQGAREKLSSAEIDVKYPHAQSALKVIMRLDVGLVADRLGIPDRREKSQLGQLREGGIHSASADRGDRETRAGKHLFCRQMLIGRPLKRLEDCASLRSHPQAVAS
jgi:hypothetical protein